MSFVVQCDFLQLTSDLLSLIVLFPYVIGTIDQKSKVQSRDAKAASMARTLVLFYMQKHL